MLDMRAFEFQLSFIRRHTGHQLRKLVALNQEANLYCAAGHVGARILSILVLPISGLGSFTTVNGCSRPRLPSALVRCNEANTSTNLRFILETLPGITRSTWCAYLMSIGKFSISVCSCTSRSRTSSITSLIFISSSKRIPIRPISLAHHKAVFGELSRIPPNLGNDLIPVFALHFLSPLSAAIAVPTHGGPSTAR